MKAQINGGAEAVQLFDSWAGALTAEEYRRIALPYSTLAFQGAPGATHVHFGVGTAHLIEAMGEISEVVSIGSDLGLDAAARRLPGKVLQGNLDPDLLVTAEQPAQTDATPTDAKPTDHMEQIWREAEQVLQAGLAAPAHIFNLGHGVRPDTDPGVLTELTARIHTWRAPATSPTENSQKPTKPTK